MIGSAEALSHLTIAVDKKFAALLIEVGCGSVVEVTHHDGEPVAGVEISLHGVPFRLVGQYCFTELVQGTTACGAVHITVRQVVNLLFVGVVEAIGVEV